MLTDVHLTACMQAGILGRAQNIHNTWNISNSLVSSPNYPPLPPLVLCYLAVFKGFVLALLTELRCGFFVNLLCAKFNLKAF